MIHPDQMKVRTGLDVLVTDRLELIRGRRAGLLCHPASVNAGLCHAADLVHDAGADLRCLLGPEHGVRGDAQDMAGVGNQQDPRLGIPVHSLYGTTARSLRPDAEVLSGLDLVVVDLQDVGSRYYTYVWTMVITMEACAEAVVDLVVLDRPNPIGGTTVEGPSIAPGYTSFVGYQPVATRHGMTAGEIATMARAELGLDLSLEVVQVEGWQRQLLQDETGLPWVLPSPNMPTLDTALVYPGGCLVEGTNLSEGRGTTRPFELLGAPWIDGWELAAALHGEDLPGVRLRPLIFQPTFHKHAGKACGGVQVHITDREAFRPLRTYVALLRWIRHLWPDPFQWREQAYEFVEGIAAIDLLAGGAWLREGMEQDLTTDQLTSGWAAEEQDFCSRREPFLLY